MNTIQPFIKCLYIKFCRKVYILVDITYISLTLSQPITKAVDTTIKRDLKIGFIEVPYCVRQKESKNINLRITLTKTK